MHVLSGDLAQEGAERLALALALTKTRTIKVPERVLEEGTDGGMLDSEKVLADWTEEQRQALLRRPIFDVATYGRVRFHHRSVAEYLAARRLKKLSDFGLPKRRLMRLLFADRYGEKVAIPSMRPIAAWLSLWDDDVRKALLEREPETLVSFGDTESLSVAARIELVKCYIGRYGAGGWRGLDLSSDDLQRLASPELADEIKKRWAEPHLNGEARLFLLKLVWLGGLGECAYMTFGAAMDIRLPPYTRTIALHALSECQRTDLLRRAADDMIANPANWPDEVMHSAPQDLYPAVITTSELVHFLKTFGECVGSIGGFLLLFLRRETGDFANIGAIDADVVQLAIRIAGKLLEYVPVGPAYLQEAREQEHFHDGLFCVISTSVSTRRPVNECVAVRNVVSLANLNSSHK